MNSNLYNNIAMIPDSLVKHLTDCFNSVQGNTNTEGYKRNEELRKSKKATYQQIKRIKNWFDSYGGNKEDSPFILNGGDRMYKWCDEVLRVWRDGTNAGKKIKSDAGMQNQYLDSHEKNSFNLNDKHGTTADDLKIKENINKINKLIKNII
jgi:hypothetical protein